MLSLICNFSSVKIEVTNKTILVPSRSQSLMYTGPHHLKLDRYSKFLSSFESALETSATARCIIGGDFNIDPNRNTSL